MVRGEAERLMPQGLGEGANQGSPGQANAAHRVYRRAMKMDDENIAQLQIAYPTDSPSIRKSFSTPWPVRIDTALQRIITQQRFSAQIRNVSFLKLISRTINVEMDFETVGGPFCARSRESSIATPIALFSTIKQRTNCDAGPERF